MLILCERRQRTLKSLKITKVNGVEPIELAKFGVDCSEYACYIGSFSLNIF